jgi:hypothetical protein
LDTLASTSRTATCSVTDDGEHGAHGRMVTRGASLVSGKPEVGLQAEEIAADFLQV